MHREASQTHDSKSQNDKEVREGDAGDQREDLGQGWHDQTPKIDDRQKMDPITILI